MKASPLLPGVSEVRLPGERLAQVTAQRKKHGIPVPAPLLEALARVAGQLQVPDLTSV